MTSVRRSAGKQHRALQDEIRLRRLQCRHALLPTKDYEIHFRNPHFAEPFRRVLDFVRPDVVHLHCIQEMDAGVIDTLAVRGIPVAVTVHDFWWLCERQFMIDLQGNYCGQRTIDYDICAACSGERAASSGVPNI